MLNVAAAIIKKESTVLLTRRAPSEKLAGYWEFPGGKQEDNETIQECLERELKEELSIETRCTDILIESPFEHSKGAFTLIAIAAEIIAGDLKLSVHDKFEWVPVKNLLDYKMPPADIPIAQFLIDELNTQ